MRVPALTPVAVLTLSVSLLSSVAPTTATPTPRGQDGQASPGAFTADVQVDVDAPRDEVYRQLLRIGEWWSPAHTVFGDASRLSLDPRPQGCWCESQPDGRGVEHMRVLGAAPGEWLRMSGGLGPLQTLPVIGVMTVTLAREEGDSGPTSVRLVYRVAGHAEGNLESWAGPVAGVLQEQLDRLQRKIETGSPDPLPDTSY